VDVQGLSGPVVGLAPGGQHTCALLDTGTVECWGGNYHGQLGDGTTQIRLDAVEVALPKGLAGDTNCDGAATSVDATLVLQLDAALVETLPCWRRGDVNDDNRINAIDAAFILQYSAALIENFPT
jgi:hypothetical protein